MGRSRYVAGLRSRIGSDLLMLPSVSALVLDEHGRMLVLRLASGGYTLPGGAIDPGEQPLDALVREVSEESGVQVRVERIIAIFGGQKGRRTYANGDQVEYVDTVFLCRASAGMTRADGDEALGASFVPPESAPLEWRFPIPLQILLEASKRQSLAIQVQDEWRLLR